MSKRPADDEEADVATKKVKRDGDASDTASQPPGGQLQKDEEGYSYLDLGNMKRATVNVFKGNAQMNIREYYTDKNGDIKPGRKGITLNRTQWDLLLSSIEPLSERLKTVESEKEEENKKKSEEKAAKKKTKEKPAKKKKKKNESEDEGSADDE